MQVTQMIKSMKRVATALVVALPLLMVAHASTPAPQASATEFQKIVNQGVPADALTMALKGYREAVDAGKVKNKKYLTVVDFTQPSNQKRLYVIDLNTNKVIYNEYVAHGAASGDAMATNFSSKNGSRASELGTIVTDDVYVGKHGESLRLDGIEDNNGNIRSRAIVVHPAEYVTDAFVKEHNRVGRSWGCFAVDPKVAPEIIDTIKGGTVIYAYATTKMAV